MFGDFVGERGATVGTGDIKMGGAFGSNLTWRSKFATGDKAFYLLTTRNAVKREIGWGVFTQSTPDTLTRNVIKSTQADTAVSWEADDVYYAYSVPMGVAMAFMLDGGLDLEAPAWMPDGAQRWAVDEGDIGVLWKRVLKSSSGEVEMGRHYVAEAFYAASRRRKWVDAGAASIAMTEDHVGQVIEFDVTAGSRTFTLLAGTADGVAPGFDCMVVGYGSTTNGVILDPDGTDKIDTADGGANVTIPPNRPTRLWWDDAKGQWRTDYQAAAASTVYAAWAGVRQTVAAGPVTSAGLPDLLPASNPGVLSVSTDNVDGTHALVVSAAAGWDATTGLPKDTVGVSTTNVAFTGLIASRAAPAPNYLYVTVAAGALTAGTTILAPVYQWGGTPAVTLGQITFNIAEMRCYLGDGTTANPVNLVLVGEAATDTTGVISTVAYAYNGRYESGWTNTLPSNSTTTAVDHNIGVPPRFVDFIVENITTELGYPVGDQISMASGALFAINSIPQVTFNSLSRTAKTMAVITQDGSGWSAVNKTTGANATITKADWKYQFVAARGW